MGKLSNKELRAYTDIGYIPPEHRISAVSVENTELDNYLNSLRYVNKRDRLSQFMQGITGEEEQKAGIDVATETLLDEDNKYRRYTTKRDLRTGEIVDKILADDIEGINIEDVISGKVENPLTRQVREQELYKKIYADIDPATDEFKNDIGKAQMQQIFDNSIWGAFDRMAGGEVSRQLSNHAIDNLEIKGGDVYYGGSKVNIPNTMANEFNDWLNKKMNYQADGFVDQLATTASSFLMDAPFFIAGGRLGGMLIEGIAPGLTAATSIPARLVKHISQNMAMLSIIDTPRIINNTIEGGTDALLDDLAGIGKFAVLAGGFGLAGEGLGLGVSRLLQKPKMLQLNQAVQFLRKNPQVVQTLAGGLTSGMLGYTTGGETYEEKLATAFTFAGMHFATPSAWKSYAKGEKKSVMLDNTNNQTRAIQTLIKQGKSLEEAIRETSAIIPDYYYREGNKMTKINKDLFVTKGEVELIPEEQFPSFELTRESSANYKYITEAVPFSGMAIKEALKQGKIQGLTTEVRKGMPENPYDINTQRDLHDSFEYGKQTVSNQIASTVYAEKLNSLFKSHQLPDEPTLNKMVVNLSDTWKLSVSEIKKQIYPNVIRYLENPSTLQRELYTEQGGELLPVLMPKYNEELGKAVKQAIDVIVQSQQQKLLPQQGSAVRIEQQIPERASIQPPTEGRVYYDMNGEIIPLDVYTGDKAKVGDIEFTPDKKNVLTKSELQKRIKEKESLKITSENKEDIVTYKLGKQTVEAEIMDVRNEGKEIVVRNNDGTQLVITPDMVKEIRSGQEQMGVSKGEQAGQGRETAEPGSRNRPTNVEREEQPSGKVDEETQRTINEEIQNELKTQEELSQKETNIPKTQLEAPQGTNVEKPIVTPTSVENEALRGSKEEILGQFKNDSLKKSAERLTTIYEPKTASYRDESGKIKPELTQQMLDIESKAEASAKKLSEATGEKITKEDVLITALKPYYTAQEIGTIFALRDIYSADADRNTNFVNNRLKKLGISFGTKAGQVGIGKAETAQAGLETTTLKPNQAFDLAEAEKAIVAESTKVQNRITELRKERDLAGTTEERKAEITTEINDLYRQQQELGKRLADLSPEDYKITGEELLTEPAQIQEEHQKLADYINKAGLDIPILSLETIPVKGGKEAAGAYTHPTDRLADDLFKMNATRLYEGTAAHEWLHFGMNRMGEEAVWNDILRQYNGDKEAVADAFAEYARAHKEIDTSTVFGKVKQLFTKIADYFRDVLGWNTKADYFRRLADGALKLREGTTETGELYKPIEQVKSEEISAEHAKELEELDYRKYLDVRGYYGSQLSFYDKIKDNTIMRKVAGTVSTLYRASFQNRNMADQRNSKGELVRPIVYRAYHGLEDKVVLPVRENINRINYNEEGWNGGKNFLELPNKEQFTAKMGDYDQKVYEGKIEPLVQDVAGGETLDGFLDRVAKVMNYTEAEKAMERRLQVHARLNQEQIREGHRDFLKENAVIDGEMVLANSLTEAQLKDYFGEQLDYTKKEVDLYKDANKLLASQPELADKIISDTIDKLHPMFYNLYRNGTRPSKLEFYSFAGVRPIDENGNFTTDKTKIAGWEKVNGYGKNEKEAQEQADKYFAEGFAINEPPTKISEIIKKEQFDRLTANQLMNLVDLGHVEANSPIVRSLLNAIKTGNYEQHTINKKYTRGMHYTPEELEMGIMSLTNEAVSASTKRYGLASVRAELAKDRAMVNAIIKSPELTKAEKDKTRRDLDYATQLYNQVSRNDQSFIDPWRKAATAWYIGVKPSFWFQQGMEVFPAILPEAVAEAKGTAINGTSAWTSAFGKSFELAKYLRATQKGVQLQTNLDKGFIDAYNKLDSQGLMGAVGIEELAGKGEDLKMRYGSDLYKGWNAMLKVVNMGGAAMEKFTRMHSLSTFYDIGKARGLEGKALEDYLIKNVKNTMKGWGALDRPAVFQSKQLGGSEQKILKAIDKAFFTFKTYSNGNLGQYDRLFRNRQWGAFGTKLMVGIGMHGITKFPLAATLFAIANLFSDDDSEYEVLKALDELDSKIGGSFGHILGKGALSLSGISMENLFDERSSFAVDVFSETRSKSAEGKLMEAMLGAPYGLAKDFLDASTGTYKLLKDQIGNDVSMDNSEKKRALKNLYKFSPLFARNILNAMSLAEDGVELRGKEILKAEDISWGDVVYKMIGFNPSIIADTYEYQFSGTPAKLTRTKGRISELKKIRKEISTSKDYAPEARKAELANIAKMIRDYQKQEATLTKQLNLEKRNKR